METLKIETQLLFNNNGNNLVIFRMLFVKHF